MKRHRCHLLCLLLGLSLICGCRDTATGPATSSRLRRVDLALNWFPDAQHGGFYAAKYHGFFTDEGLDVQLVPGGPAAPVVQNVALKRALFGVGNADQILMARQQQAPIVAVMAAIQDSPRCIMVHEASGITRLDELRNVTLAVGAGQAFARFLQTRCDLSSVRVVPYTGSIAPFLNNPRLAQQAYVFSEPVLARQQGARPRCLLVSELGFNPYTSCLLTHEDLIRDDPQLVARMVRAVRRGWQAYLQKPEPIHTLIHQDNLQMDLETLRSAAEAIRPLCLPRGSNPSSLGSMSTARWNQLGQQLVELGFVDSSLDISQAFTLQFLADDGQ